MNKAELQALGESFSKNIKTEQDLNEFRQMLTKMTVEAALNGEIEEHLGFSKHEKANKTNSRNGHSRKTLQTEDGQFELKTPRDRNGDFEPELAKLSVILGWLVLFTIWILLISN